MTYDLPAMQALRAFEAAARHLSYTRAGVELSLTHGAISRHISRLEKDLGGVRLFVREGQRMQLTDAGQVFVLDVRRGLELLSDAMANTRARPRRPVNARRLSVSVHPAFAARWLLPRLGRFQRSHPSVEIAVHPTSALATLDARDGIHMALRYGPGRWPGLKSSRLMKSFLFPVCSPAFLAAAQFNSPADLLTMRLLRSPRQKWRPWFQAAGLDVPEPDHGTTYDDAGLLLQAAATGEGIALARSALVADDLAEGRLVRLFDVEVEDTYGWHLAWRDPPHCDPSDLNDFRQWLGREALSGAALTHTDS